ncbi:MAG: riboflavin biosynthesis protein RibF [Phycisphaeraceae bacterium]
MAPSSVITIGTFDGVHLGHRALIDQARRVAHAHDAAAQVVAFAFDPHPASILRPGSEPPRLTTRNEKIRRLRDAGADRVVILEPTRELLGQSPQQFIEHLASEHHPIAIIEGPDFRFGKGRRGDIALLRQLGERFGFQVHVQEPVEVELTAGLAAPVSSSLVRWLVAHGRMLDAAICLNEPYALTAPVVTGDQRGRTIGVPTVNLDNAPLREQLVPPDGVYAGTVELHPDHDLPGPRHAAALSIGAKPTFGDAPVTVEAHLLDFDGDLYGRTVTVRFARWLRAQERFPNLESLQAQLQRDIAHTRWCQRCGLLNPPHQQPRLTQRAG